MAVIGAIVGIVVVVTMGAGLARLRHDATLSSMVIGGSGVADLNLIRQIEEEGAPPPPPRASARADPAPTPSASSRPLRRRAPRARRLRDVRGGRLAPHGGGDRFGRRQGRLSRAERRQRRSTAVEGISHAPGMLTPCGFRKAACRGS